MILYVVWIGILIGLILLVFNIYLLDKGRKDKLKEQISKKWYWRKKYNLLKNKIKNLNIPKDILVDELEDELTKEDLEEISKYNIKNVNCICKTKNK